MRARILHDIHIGAVRSAGTTISSQWQLRQHLRTEFARLLPSGEDLIILGDLFDTNNVALYDVLETYNILLRWAQANPGSQLINVRGNHDASKTSNILSSFDLLGGILESALGRQYIHVAQPTMTEWGYIIPHMPNQEQFDLALTQVPECDYLLVHCNYDNHFAQQADQSLNMSEKQVLDCLAKKVIFAHEHHGRNFGKVLVPGNQIASSVSDWLSPQNKRFLTLDSAGPHFFTECAVRAEEYAELDWKNPQKTEAKFIRMVGSATAEESVDLVNAVNRYRKASDAYVVTNAVAVETEEMVVNFEESLQAVQVFSVVEALRKFLTAEEMAVVEPLCS